MMDSKLVSMADLVDKDSSDANMALALIRAGHLRLDKGEVSAFLGKGTGAEMVDLSAKRNYVYLGFSTLQESLDDSKMFSFYTVSPTGNMVRKSEFVALREILHRKWYKTPHFFVPAKRATGVMGFKKEKNFFEAFKKGDVPLFTFHAAAKTFPGAKGGRGFFLQDILTNIKARDGDLPEKYTVAAVAKLLGYWNHYSFKKKVKRGKMGKLRLEGSTIPKISVVECLEELINGDFSLPQFCPERKPEHDQKEKKRRMFNAQAGQKFLNFIFEITLYAWIIGKFGYNTDIILDHAWPMLKDWLGPLFKGLGF